jgi:hypothetical protein
MKKLFVVLLALGLVVAFSVPACAVDNIFGGYWRTRAFMQKDFNGIDDGAADIQRIDTRTRLYYTAKFSDNFKFVNKFEMDAVWGDAAATGYGDIGADGVKVEVKNSYVDFTIDSVNAKIGVQTYGLARGFLFSDDVAGAVVTYKGDGVSVPFAWLKAYEGSDGKTADSNDGDVDYYTIAPKFSIDKVTVNPYVMWATSDDYSAWQTSGTTRLDYPEAADVDFEEFDLYYLGLDANANLGAASVWFTGIYEMGTVGEPDGPGEIDLAAYLVALGGSTKVGAASVHGQVFYATGQDPDDNDATQFWVPKGSCYYWSEIMGLGIFDAQDSNASCDDNISNIVAFNIGATVKPMDKVSVTLDLWNAALVEDDANGENSLGTEVDLKVSYALLENLKLEAVAAYLFAGDATTGKATNDANPYELGTRLSFSF